MKKINNLSDIKIDNINLIIDTIRNNKDITRIELAGLSGLSGMSITRIVSLLLENNFIYEGGEILNKRGRPAKLLHINPSALYTLTIYIDVNTLIIAVVDLNNIIILQSNINSNEINTMKDYIDAAYEGYKEMIKEHRDIQESIKCISIVCSGVVDNKKNEVIISAQLKWRNAKIGDYTRKKFGITTIVDNDVKSALIGEISYNRKYNDINLAYMDIGYGIGVGLWIGGQILRGANNSAGEIGHITIDYNGLQCECGRRGCLNTALNIKSFINRAREKDNSIKSIEDIVQKYKMQEKWAISLVDDVCMYFSIALNNIINAYDPAVIIVGGKFIDQFNGFLDIISSSQHFIQYGKFKIDADIQLSSMGEKSYIIGGAINSQRLIFNNLFS
nr:ROK family protein [Sedimentibacter sp.]